MDLRQHDRCCTGMVTGIGFSLFVTGFMFLIHDDKSYIRDGQKDGTACTDHYMRFGSR